MVRTQIQLTEDQYRRLKRWSRKLGISLAEAIRRCVAESLVREESAPGRKEMVRAALAVCGKYSDPKGPLTVARDHDRYPSEAYRS